MANTRRNRRNRKNTMRKNRKQRGAGFFDWFKRSAPAEASAAPVAAAPAVAPAVNNTKAPINTNLPATPTATTPNAPRRSFMNRFRNATGRVGSSFRSARNTMTSTAKNYGTHLKTMRNTLRNPNVRSQMF